LGLDGQSVGTEHHCTLVVKAGTQAGQVLLALAGAIARGKPGKPAKPAGDRTGTE
jgi:hypothetical protein